MNNNLTFYINDESVFEYDRDTAHDEKQLAFLNNMDGGMDKGIKMRGELITQPSTEQRLTFSRLI